MCTDGKTYKTKADEMADGTFAAFYGEKNFVKVKQALKIGKVRFAFVEIGKNGAGIDVYVDADDFDNLCDDIMTGRLQKKMAESKSSYPDAWKYVTGTDASKELNIGKGQKADVVIQGRDKKANKNMFVGVLSFNEMRTMAKWWKRISKNYYENLVQVCLNATTYKQDEEDLTKPDVSATNNETTKVAEPAPEEKEQITKIRVIATAPCKEREKAKGDYAMQGKNVENDERVNIVFKKESISGMSVKTWKTLLEKSADKETPLDFTANFIETMEENTKVFVFKEFAK